MKDAVICPPSPPPFVKTGFSIIICYKIFSVHYDHSKYAINKIFIIYFLWSTMSILWTCFFHPWVRRGNRVRASR